MRKRMLGRMSSPEWFTDFVFTESLPFARLFARLSTQYDHIEQRLTIQNHSKEINKTKNNPIPI